MKEWINAKQLHDWYLEAIRTLHPESYNPNAAKPFEELTEEQQEIDKYIATRVNGMIKTHIERLEVVMEKARILEIALMDYYCNTEPLNIVMERIYNAHKELQQALQAVKERDAET